MKDNPVEMALLFDFYGDILTDRQKDFFDLYHNNDLSLSEIAENAGITRQGVRDIINRAEQTLRTMEDKLRLVERYKKIQGYIVEIRSSAQLIDSINNRSTGHSDIRYRSQRIAEIAEMLINDYL